MKDTWFHRILLPGFLFQSVIIGGGYATGRELVEFFLSLGLSGGLLGMAVATALFSLCAALSFEFARQTRSYDYRTFFQNLIGRGWVLFEIAYFILGLLILAVIGAAAGELVSKHLGLNAAFGSMMLMLLIGVLVFWGTSAIERALAAWSLLLYVSYTVFVFLYLQRFGDGLAHNIASAPVGDGWLLSGVKYAGYSITALAVILFCVKHMHSRRDAFVAGALTGPVCMAPAVIFYLAMAATYPEVLNAPVPADFMIQRLDMAWVKIVFYIVIFGTFVETGSAYIHAVNERIFRAYEEQNRVMPKWLRPVIAFAALSVSIGLAATIGLVDLISKGYGTLTWAFVLIFILPLLTVGVLKIRKAPGRKLA